MASIVTPPTASRPVPMVRAVTGGTRSGAGAVALVAIVLAGLVVTELAVQVQVNAGDIGIDFGFYRDAGARWLATGAFYLPRQLEGPYPVGLMVDVLYPPNALVLFVPLALLPAPLAAVAWWTIPIAVTASAVRAWRPAPWAIAVAIAVLLWPRALGAFVFGNSDMWMMAAVAAALLWGWPVVGLLLKPVFAPFALLFARDRRARAGVLALAPLSAPMAFLWVDYATAMHNAQGLGLAYSLGSLPLLLVPVALWAGRATRRAASPARAPGGR